MKPSDIPVVILCGGQGTRLREETEFKPKPMVTVGDRPILWHLMKYYSHFGFNRFILCLGYRGDYIKEYFYNYETMNSDFTIDLAKKRVQFHSSHPEQWEVTLADTGLEAMTGARIKRIERYVQAERFCLTYGDGLSNVDLHKLLAFHESHGKLATMTAVHPPSRFGTMEFEGERITSFAEKPNMGEGFINGGFFVCERGVFDYLERDDACIFERAPLERLAQDDQLLAYRHGDFWQCMDTIRDAKLLNDLWASGESPWRIWGDRQPIEIESKIPAALPPVPAGDRQ